MGKTINTRIQLKSDTELNWRKSVLSIDNEIGTKENVEGARSFIPQKGEAIIFEPDNEHSFSRLKIGDGITNVLSLPFIDAGTTNGYIVRKEVPSNAEFTDTTYSSGSGISIDNNNIINHTNSITPSSDSEKKVYKITYDSEGHITNAEEINVGTVTSVQIQASSPLQSSVSTSQTETLNTTISFTAQDKNTVFAGPTESNTDTPSFRLLTADDIPNLPASKITGTFLAEQIGNLPASKITSEVLNEDRIPNLEPNKISGVIPISKGGTGVDGINGDSEHNVNAFINNGIFAYDSINARFKQFGITTPGNTDTFTDYVNSLNGATGNLIVDLNTLIKAVPPINLKNPRDITENYINSYYAPKTKGWKNSVLISQGEENFNKGTEPIWLNPTALSAEGFHGGTLFYGRYSREVERIVDDETVTLTETGFETQWGTLPVEQGGTGITNFNNDYVLIGSGENPIRTIQKTSSLISNTIVERDTNGDFATRSITLSQNLLYNNVNENFKDNKIISIDSSNKLATFFGNVNANNLTAFIGELKMSKTNSETIDQPSIKWYKGKSIKTESAITSQTNTLIGELYWDHNNSNRGMLRNYYLVNNTETYSDSYYLPETDTSSANNNIFTLLATEDSISNMFPSNSILYSNGKVNKITYKNSADGALYSTSTNGNLEWGTLPVAQGGTGLTTSGTVNAVIIGNSVESYKTRAFQTVSTNNGAFYATGVNSKPEFGTLPIGQGGTGVTSIADIQAGKDGDGNTISSTYLKLSGGTMTGPLTLNNADRGSRAIHFYVNGTEAGWLSTEDQTNVMQFVQLNPNVAGAFALYQFPAANENPYGFYEILTTKSPVLVTQGGTGATTPAQARANLEITPTNIGAVAKTGDIMTGSLTIQNNGLWVQGGSEAGSNNSRMGLSGGMPDAFIYNTSKRGVKIYSNAIAFADPYNGNSNNDAGWIRHLEETSNSGILEIGVGDDGDENIVVRQYNTSSSVVRTLTLLDSLGNTTIPRMLSVASTGETGSYDQAAMQIREYNYAGVGTGTWGQAPRLAWHWSGRVAAQIGLATDGYLYTAPATGTNFYKLMFESGTWGINITGNAATATKATQDSDGNAINSTYLKLSGGTLTGNISFSNSGTSFRGINYGTMGDNDQWRIGGAATASNSGYMEIATADDGNEPIYVRQYTGVFSSIARTLTLLNASGNTEIPGQLTVSGVINSGSYILANTYVQAKQHMYLDSGHLYLKYNDTWYNVVHNHANGNVSYNACGGGLYIGYNNTTLMNWLNGKMTLSASGNLTTSGSVYSPVIWANQGTGERQMGVTYSNGNLYFWGNPSSGTAGIYDSNGGYVIQRETTYNKYNSFFSRTEITNHLVCSTKTAGNAFHEQGSAIQIREVGLVGTAQSAWTYAPKIGFHWSGKCALQLGMDSSQWLHLYNNNSTSHGAMALSRIIVDGANGVRFAVGSGTTKSMLLRNDGSNFWFLCCNSAGDGDNWYTPTCGDNPMRINLDSGNVYIRNLTLGTVLPITSGGTGATTEEGARENLHMARFITFSSGMTTSIEIRTQLETLVENRTAVFRSHSTPMGILSNNKITSSGVGGLILRVDATQWRVLAFVGGSIWSWAITGQDTKTGNFITTNVYKYTGIAQ